MEMRESELLNCLTEVVVYLIFCSPDILIFIVVVVQLLSSVQLFTINAYCHGVSYFISRFDLTGDLFLQLHGV